MQLDIFTCRFSPTHARFDDRDLKNHLARRELIACSEHLIACGDESFLVCVVKTREPTREPARSARTRSSEPVDLDAASQQLYESLRHWRRERSEKDGMPPYTILTNAALHTIAYERPTSRAALLQVPGLGEKKLARFGEQVLGIVRDAEAAESTDPEQP